MTTIPSAAVPAVTSSGTNTPSQNTAASTNTASSPGASSSNPLNQLDNTQTFLNLLVAQLENQDPTNPANPTSFMTEISQLAGVESQTSLSAEEQVVAADSMIGMDVTGSSASGTLSGTVTGVLLSASGAPELEIGTNGQQLSLSAVTQVVAAPKTGSAAGTSGGTSTTGSAGTSGGTSTTGAGGTSGATGATSVAASSGSQTSSGTAT